MISKYNYILKRLHTMTVSNEIKFYSYLQLYLFSLCACIICTYTKSSWGNFITIQQCYTKVTTSKRNHASLTWLPYTMTSDWIHKERAVDVVYLDFSEAFDTVPHDILWGKLRKCRLDRWMVRWIKSWLNGRSQGVVISGKEPTYLNSL